MRLVLGLLWAGGCPKAPPAPPPKPVPAAPAPSVAPAEATDTPLHHPGQAVATAPDVFRVTFETTAGTFVVEAHRDWAPIGVDRFYNLVDLGYYDGCKFFRVVDGFMAQFGIHGDPTVNVPWRDARITDDRGQQSNARGMLSFAKGGPNTRTTQLFINTVDNAALDKMGFPVIGEVIEGMDVVDSLYAGYGEGAPRGRGPNQALIQTGGNGYLEASFPELDGIIRAWVQEDPPDLGAPPAPQ